MENSIKKLLFLSLFFVATSSFGQFSSNSSNAGDNYENLSEDVKAIVDANKSFNRDFYFGLSRYFEFTIQGVESKEKLSAIKSLIENQIPVLKFSVDEKNRIHLEVPGKYSSLDLKTAITNGGFQIGSIQKYNLDLSSK